MFKRHNDGISVQPFRSGASSSKHFKLGLHELLLQDLLQRLRGAEQYPTSGVLLLFRLQCTTNHSASQHLPNMARGGRQGGGVSLAESQCFTVITNFTGCSLWTSFNSISRKLLRLGMRLNSGKGQLNKNESDLHSPRVAVHKTAGVVLQYTLYKHRPWGKSWS